MKLFQKIDKRQEYTKKSKAKFELLKSSLYQDLKEGIIAEEEFYDMREFYTNRIVESELILEKQGKEIARLSLNPTSLYRSNCWRKDKSV